MITWAKPDVSTSYSIYIVDTAGCASEYQGDYYNINVISTGITSNNLPNSILTVFSNPTYKRVTINFHNPEKELIKLTIINVNGKVVKQVFTQSDFFHVTGLESKGIFFFTLRKDSQIIGTGKFIKN